MSLPTPRTLAPPPRRDGGEQLGYSGSSHCWIPTPDRDEATTSRLTVAILFWCLYVLPVLLKGISMQGRITSRHVLRHPVLICRSWGAGCYLRCLRAVITHRRCTFLELITENS